MIITVKGKEMELNFGVRFIREIDKKTERVTLANGYEQKFSEGIAYYVPQLMLENPVYLADVLYCALWQYKGTFKYSDIEDYIDSLDSEEYSQLFEDVLVELENANSTKKVVRAMKEEMQKAQKDSK